MKVRYGEDLANHSDPESCVCHREVAGEALTGEIGGRAIEPRNPQSGMPTLLGEAEGNTKHRVIASDVLIPRGHRTSARHEVFHTGLSLVVVDARFVQSPQSLHNTTTAMRAMQ